jgi:hypothetical protein
MFSTLNARSASSQACRPSIARKDFGVFSAAQRDVLSVTQHAEIAKKI